MDDKLIEAFDNAVKTANDINKRLIILCLVMAGCFGISISWVAHCYFNSLYVPTQTQEIEQGENTTKQNQNGGN